MPVGPAKCPSTGLIGASSIGMAPGTPRRISPDLRMALLAGTGGRSAESVPFDTGADAWTGADTGADTGAGAGARPP